ncbi:MAG: hypothetical protein AB7G40_10620 [Hyphomonadaceae bacterium]
MPHKLRGADNQEIAHEVRQLRHAECVITLADVAALGDAFAEQRACRPQQHRLRPD